MELFKKDKIVGVSVTPEIGLEIAEIDYETKTVLKYGSKPLEYNVTARKIADMDLFKDRLQELLEELEISKSSKLVLSLPAVTYRISDYPAALDENDITNALTESLLADPIFDNEEPCFAAEKLPNSSIQFHKVAYTAMQHNVVSEIVMIIRSLGYKIYAIDSSLSTTYNALNYIERLANVEPDTSWVLMVVDNFMCRVVSMIGYNPVDVFEEKLAISPVLDDAENYSTVLSSAQPILKNNPSKYLYVVSKTNIINAEILAGRLQYNAPIIHQEANIYSKEAFLNVSAEISSETAKQISLDVIGAAIRREFESFKSVNLNLYNKTLGYIYTQDQPPQIEIFGQTYVLTTENLIKMFIAIFIVVLVIAIPTIVVTQQKIRIKSEESEKIQSQIAALDKFLEENKEFASDTFDEAFEIKTGLLHNKNVYSYYTIVGTEIPKKLWLTHLSLGDKITIEGQADNLESVYGFFRSIKDYDAQSDIKLQKLGLATNSGGISEANADGFDKESILTSLNADFYEFRISNEPEVTPSDVKDEDKQNSLPDLEPAN